MVAEALGITPGVVAADMEFACKAGSEAMQAAVAFVGAGMVDGALAIGMDTAQSKPGDALEYTAGCGGAAYLFGPADSDVAVVEASVSYVTDTPYFFRREHASETRYAIEQFGVGQGAFRAGNRAVVDDGALFTTPRFNMNIHGVVTSICDAIRIPAIKRRVVVVENRGWCLIPENILCSSLPECRIGHGITRPVLQVGLHSKSIF